MGYSTGREYFPLVAEGHTPAVTAGFLDLTPSFKVPSHTMKGAIFIAPAVGAAGNVAITLGGTYAVGDQVRITLSSNLVSGQFWSKSYLVEVQAGATALADIALALANKMNRDVANANAPLASAVAAGAVVTVTQKGDDKRGLADYDWTDSAAGTIAIVNTATTISEGQPDDLYDRGVAPEDVNLASYDTVKIVFDADSASPFIDSRGVQVKEIYWYGTPGEGNALATLINGL